MIVKKGKAEIIDVIDDGEHAIDDEGTRKAMKRAGQDTENWAKVLSKGNTGEGTPIEIPLAKDTEIN